MERDLSDAAPEDVGLSPAGLERVDDALRELIGAGELAGAVTLVARHGRVVHRAALGAKDLASGEALATDTIFRIYSMTKPVTGVAMMILYDRGLWRPSDPIAKFLPSFADVKVFGGLDGAGEPIPEDPDHAPTMSELMTHTAGFSYGFDPENPVDKFYLAADPWRAASLGQFAERVASAPLAYQPGSKWLYSLSMDIQGAIVEALSGQMLPVFMAERIFQPLGMVDTGFFVPTEKRARLATLYRKSKSRGLAPIERAGMILPDHDGPPAVASGGGGLVGTADDYARFAQMLLDGGEFGGVRIVSVASLALMMTNHLSPELLAGGFGVGKQQMRPGYGYGYDGAVYTDPALADVPVGEGTYQWDGAAGTWFWVDPVNDLLFVGLIQRLDPDSPALQVMTQRLIAEAIA
ncbi:MAG TPA: serine hydrolase domain-containing protein [Caulobacteraceae bacterium]